MSRDVFLIVTQVTTRPLCNNCELTRWGDKPRPIFPELIMEELTNEQIAEREKRAAIEAELPPQPNGARYANEKLFISVEEPKPKTKRKDEVEPEPEKEKLNLLEKTNPLVGGVPDANPPIRK